MARVTAGPECLLAWLLGEGDTLAGGEKVLRVQREPVGGVVTVACDDGSRRWFGRHDRVMVARRATVDDAPAWRVARFVAGAASFRSAGRATAEAVR
jgi:hypothetical protein